jgi:GNAT superfamily N-acetyltransferase
MVRPPGGPILRRATARDARGVADVWLASFRAALPTVRLVHTDDEVRNWIARTVVAEYETWVAEAGDEVVGMMALHDDWIEQLYLHPDWRGRGLGAQFLTLARNRRPDGLQLWAFQVNGPARRFYERHGFVARESTDGARNAEHEPDVRYEWRPASSGDGAAG